MSSSSGKCHGGKAEMTKRRETLNSDWSNGIYRQGNEGGEEEGLRAGDQRVDWHL